VSFRIFDEIAATTGLVLRGGVRLVGDLGTLFLSSARLAAHVVAASFQSGIRRERFSACDG